MPSSSHQNSESAAIPAMKQTMPAIMRPPVPVVIMTEKKQNPRSPTANSKAKIFQFRNRLAFREPAATEALGPAIESASFATCPSMNRHNLKVVSLPVKFPRANQ